MTVTIDPRLSRVWCAVIAQAIEDACGSATVFGPERDRARDEAREWLTKPSRDLREVCDLAGLEMQTVIRFATAEIEKADTQPRRRKYGGRQRLITFGGETLSLTEWAHRIGIGPDSLAKRFRQGWTLERALTTPAPGGGSQLSPEAQGPAGVHRAQSAENRVSESKEAA